MTTKHTARSIMDRFFEAERQFTIASDDQKDFGPVAATIAEDCKLLQTSGLPYAGTYRGPQGMLDWMTHATKWFSKIDVQNPKIFESTQSSRLIIMSTVHFTIRETGEEASYPFIQTISVDLEKGQITELTPWYWDVTDLNRRIGYRSESEGTDQHSNTSL